jgi:hypothetical protein
MGGKARPNWRQERASRLPKKDSLHPDGAAAQVKSNTAVVPRDVAPLLALPGLDLPLQVSLGFSARCKLLYKPPAALCSP